MWARPTQKRPSIKDKLTATHCAKICRAEATGRPPTKEDRVELAWVGDHECFEWVPRHMASSTPAQSSSPIARWSKKTVTASLRPLCLLLRALCRSCKRAPWQSQTRLALKDRNGQNHAPFLTWPQALALQLPAQPRMPARLKASESALGEPASRALPSNGSAEPQLAAATGTSSRGRVAPTTAIRRCALHVRKVPDILSLVDPGRLNGNANELKQWSALCASLHLSRRALGS